jgi:anion-transporting  ArsA/GET3 family ATPase
MKKFIRDIQKKDAKITKYFKEQEYAKLEKIAVSLEKEHQKIKKNLKEINYLLSLIEKHQLELAERPSKKIKEHKSWLEKIKNNIEKYHLFNTQNLTSNDIDFLQKEQSKLLFERAQLEKEHYHTHQLIAKVTIYLMDVRNVVCKEITKGYDIATVGNKLLENFGKEIKGEYDYNTGRKKIMKFLESIFSINKIDAKELVELLEKSKVIYYKTDYSNIIEIPNYENFIEFTDLNYTPLFGNWYINA